MNKPRRVRVGIKADKPRKIAPSAKKQMTMLADKIEQAQEQIEELQNTIKEDLSKLEALMKDNGVQVHAGKIGLAEFVVPASRSTRVIDPLKYYENVDEADFFSSITVRVTDAKKFLSDKELDSISHIKKPKPKEPVLKVRPVK